jgi:hypothetical protein
MYLVILTFCTLPNQNPKPKIGVLGFGARYENSHFDEAIFVGRQTAILIMEIQGAKRSPG